MWTYVWPQLWILYYTQASIMLKYERKKKVRNSFWILWQIKGDQKSSRRTKWQWRSVKATICNRLPTIHAHIWNAICISDDGWPLRLLGHLWIYDHVERYNYNFLAMYSMGSIYFDTKHHFIPTIPNKPLNQTVRKILCVLNIFVTD